MSTIFVTGANRGRLDSSQNTKSGRGRSSFEAGASVDWEPKVSAAPSLKSTFSDPALSL